MLRRMRMTIRLDHDLLRQAKALAARTLPDVNVLVHQCRFPGLRWRDPGA